MIEKYINDKLLYKKGKNVFINQNNAVDFLKNKDNTYESKIKFLEHIRILEDYNAINILLKNFIEFPEDIRSYIITFLNGIPFTKIEENLKKLLNHREIPIRLSTLKALKNSSNPDLLEIIHPLIQHGNSEVKLSSLTAYFKIVSNIVSADISLLLSSEDAEVKQAAYESLKEITKSFTDIEEMKNITLIDSDLEKINNSSLKENFSAKGNISELVNSIEKIEKNSNYSFISILSIFALLSIIIVSNFYLYRKNDTENLLSFSPPKSVIFSPETTLSNEARVNGLEEFTRGNFDTAERYFQLINDTHIKNY
ncbi:MAG: HEAT repeat domain-containing protein, partial [Candidatus Muiribacteriota bacterium]